jgi:hypothetical protein
VGAISSALPQLNRKHNSKGNNFFILLLNTLNGKTPLLRGCLKFFLKTYPKANFLYSRGTVFVVESLNNWNDMEMKWNEFDADALKTMYDQESAALKSALLRGTPWEDLREQRLKVTELSIALHKKIHSGNPAESVDRSEKRIQR